MSEYMHLFSINFYPPIHMQFHYLLAVRKLAQTTPVQDSRSFVTATSSFQTVARAPDPAAIVDLLPLKLGLIHHSCDIAHAALSMPHAHT